MNPFHPSWDEYSREKIARAISRHGGWDAWTSLGPVSLKPLVLRGMVPFLKGVGVTFTLPSSFEIFARDRRVIFHDYPVMGAKGEFDNGRVRLWNEKGELCFDRQKAREKFRGLVKLQRWQPEDAAYFFGYAWSNYVGVPFILPALKLRRNFRFVDEGAVLEAFAVELPFDSHSHLETFCFDSTGLLRRHDYSADIVSRLACGAHYSADYVDKQGVKIATTRHVLARLGRTTVPLTALYAELE